MPTLDSSALNALVQRAADALGADPAAARRDAEAVLAAAPNDPRARLILASARRRSGDVDGAYAILAPLAKAFPRAARTQYELGVAQARRGERGAAVATLRRAVSIDPSLAEAWRELGDQLFLEGDAQGAETAFAEHGRANVRDPGLRPAADALFEGRLADAEDLLRRRVAQQPRDGVALRLLGECLTRQDRHGEAAIVLNHRLELDPDDHGARFTLAQALFKQQRADEAAPHLRRLIEQDEDLPAYRNLLAGCLSLLGDYAGAIELYEQLLATFSRQPRIWLNLGHALRTVGRGDEALAAYRRAIELAPSLGEAYWSLANLKTARFGEAEVEAMSEQLANADIDSDDRLHLRYALGKAEEDLGRYAESFAHYAAGAALRRAQVRYDPGAEVRLAKSTRALYSRDFFAAREGWGSADCSPIFVVGLPRSGSTLIEQILASHSQVEGTMELPDMFRLVSRLDMSDLDPAGVGYPDSVVALSADQAEALGRAYLDSTRVHRRLGRAFFIDKMPNNFWNTGLIHLTLPNAKIIDMRRHPLSTCFSCFKQLFAEGQGFTYDLTDLGRYYREYVETMAHFDRILPGRVHRVIYDDLVNDTETTVRMVLAYCGLPFEENCLRFHETRRAVRTVSSEQVRRPIFREGLEQWRQFEPWLEPLKGALGPVLGSWRGDNSTTLP